MLNQKLNTLDDYKRLLEILNTLNADEHFELMRELLRTDLFFMMTIGLGRKDVWHPWLLERCKEVEAAPDGCLDLWARAHYKDLWCGTPVLTSKGWVRHGDLGPGHKVYTPAGKLTDVVAAKHFSDSEIYKIEFCNNINIFAGAGHLWEVNVPSRKRVSGTKNKRITRIKKLMTTKEIFALCDKPIYRLAISIAEPLQNKHKRLPIEPYLLGAWLGDGFSSSSSICGIDSFIFEEIERRGSELRPPQKIDMRNRHKNYRVQTVKNLLPALKRIKLFKNKHIPEMYLTASVRQREALLQGLVDTDGSITSDRNSTCQIVCSNYKMAKQIRTLVNSLGFKGRLTPIRTARSWSISFQVNNSHAIKPCLMPRKAALLKDIEFTNQSKTWRILSVKKVEKHHSTNCIQVAAKDGMYLAGKELIPTHNSTIITLGKTVQDILASHGDKPLEKWAEVEPTVGIFSCTRPLAKQFLAQIKREFEINEVLRQHFPDVLWANPNKEAPVWSLDSGIIVKRKSNPKEATVEAWGLVDGQPTGKHFYMMVYDDVVTIDNVRSTQMIEKTTEAWELSLNLGTHGGIYRYIGTRYHYADTYKVMIDRGSAKPRLHPATVDGSMEGEPVFLSREELAEKRRNQGPYTFSSQQLLNPIADDTQGFKKEWLEFYDPYLWDNMNVYILVDPANEKKKTSDYTVFTVVGLASDNNYYILEWTRDRLSLTERGDELFRLHRKYRPKMVGYERYGMQADIAYIKDVSRRTNYNFKIVELKGQVAKNDRIRAMIPLFEEARIYIPNSCYKTDYEKKTRNLTDVFINEEYLSFPVAMHDDMLDSLARILDEDLKAVWPKYIEPAQRYTPRGPARMQSTGSGWGA